MSKVLVLDAELKTMLSVIRSLGKAKLETIALCKGKSGGYLSKYALKKIDLGDYPGNPVEVIKKIVEIEKIRCIFTHRKSTKIMAYKAIEESGGDVIIIPPDLELLELASNKEKIINIAKNIRLPVPETWVVDNPNELDFFEFKDKLPLFAKIISEIGIPPGPGQRYLYIEKKEDIEDLKKFIAERGKVLLQRYIRGYGCGIGGLFLNGKPIAVGGHVRIREAFKLGGPSTVCVSKINKKALEYALKLMKELRYSGLGMVEFKVSYTDQEPYLMELNPRPWGTLQAYINSGLDLPLMAYKVFVQNEVPENTKFKENVKTIFLFEDLKAIQGQYNRRIKKIKEIIKDLLEIGLGLAKEGVLDLKDPKPFLLPLGYYMLKL
jgi:predicted ATP-grasp superfamily ATP-dependent carboligase